MSNSITILPDQPPSLTACGYFPGEDLIECETAGCVNDGAHVAAFVTLRREVTGEVLLVNAEGIQAFTTNISAGDTAKLKPYMGVTMAVAFKIGPVSDRCRTVTGQSLYRQSDPALAISNSTPDRPLFHLCEPLYLKRFIILRRKVPLPPKG